MSLTVFLIIIGAVLQALGIGFVFYELALIRVRELGRQPMLERLADQARDLLKPANVVEAEAKLAAASDLSVGVSDTVSRGTATLRDAHPGEHANGKTRIAWLERQVRILDHRDSGLIDAIKLERKASADRAGEIEAAIRAQIDQLETERKSQHWRSGVRQAVGAGLIVLGLSLGTWGAVTASSAGSPKPPGSTHQSVRPDHKPSSDRGNVSRASHVVIV